jgi:hypothetical protein
MIYSKRHSLAWKPAKTLDEALQRMVNPTPADEAHDAAVMKVMGFTSLAWTLDHLNLDLGSIIDEFIDDLSMMRGPLVFPGISITVLD